MPTGLLVMVILTCLTWFNLAIQWYSQFGTYALFASIAEAAGREKFIKYHRAYERRLPATVLIPYGALMVATIVFQFVFPPQIGLASRLLVLVLNAGVAVVSAAFAAPAHNRMDRQGGFDPQASASLLRYNAVRLMFMTGSACTVVILLSLSIV